jgi:hypothetical protein
MDFIVGLPKLGNKFIIVVVMDRLCKYAHFCALQHPFCWVCVIFFACVCVWVRQIRQLRLTIRTN